MLPNITENSAPPLVGESTENLVAEFKSKNDPRQEEKAKDVAAIANALGGVVWVGVDEDKANRVVKGYEAMTSDEAERVRTQYAQAVEVYCSPQPLVDPRFVPVPGGLVVAVNVYPFPGQAIGVRSSALSSAERPAYTFPIRQGHRTSFLKAEQLPMLMVPEVRRIAILLNAIPRGAVVTLQSGSNTYGDLRFENVEILRNIVVLRHSDPKFLPQHVPLDCIASVWNDAQKGGATWRILVRDNVVVEADGLKLHVR